MLPLVGYSDALSVAPSGLISFMISTDGNRDVDAQLVRVLCADANPHGPGYREADLDASINGRYSCATQHTALGSHGVIEDLLDLDVKGVTLGARIWPTLRKGRQALIFLGEPGSINNAVLWLDEEHRLNFSCGRITVTSERQLRSRAWYAVSGGYDPVRGLVWVEAVALKPAVDEHGSDRAELRCDYDFSTQKAVCVVAARAVTGSGHLGEVSEHYNGKIEAPSIHSIDAGGDASLLAEWDFSQNISSDIMVDVGPSSRHGRLINMPTRAMKGSSWTGEFLKWQERPDQYAAIHFHDDDIYDCCWEPSIRWRVPEDFPSGLYALRLRAGDYEDHIPFVVRPALNKPNADVVFVISTFTYLAYCNFASPGFDERARQKVNEWGAYPWLPHDHPEFGLSTYDSHSDGSGVCYSSRLRPNLFMRPRFIAATDPRGSGLRHYAADTYITAWLEHEGVDFDVVTDEDLHRDGPSVLEPYRVVLTGTHPEYHTRQSLDAYQGYVDGGGRLMYLGGNGFYWKIAVNDALPGVIELRRAEGGIRLWAAEAGEYYNSLDGSYGGLWRRNGRPPNLLAGVGFSAQGNYEGSFYRRQAGSFDTRASFAFQGISAEELIGDFGFFGGGAAGFELDRADVTLGTPDHALILATSGMHGEMYRHVNEELLRQVSHRPSAEVLRSDIVFFETAQGGAVFSVGSITYCGSLPYNGYRNNVARMTSNVLRRFMEPANFDPPRSFVRAEPIPQISENEDD